MRSLQAACDMRYPRVREHGLRRRIRSDANHGSKGDIVLSPNGSGPLSGLFQVSIATGAIPGCW